MKSDKRREQQLKRLNEVQRLTQQRMDARRRKIDARFGRMRQRIAPDSSAPSDDQRRIINTALDLLDDVGLNDLTLRKLAAMLGMQAPALYWHFQSKAALTDYMAEAILQAEFKTLTPRAQDEAWQDWLVAACKRLRRAMLARRDGARVVAGAHLCPAVTLMKLLEVSMQSLTSAGMEIRQANLVISTAVHFVFGNVIEQQSSPSREEIEQFNFHLLDADFPLMSKSVQQSIADAKNGYDEFEDALRLIIGYPG